MEIKTLLEPIEVDYNEREGNLDVEAVGVVKSKKYFPIFNVNGEDKVFKPLSKTKPLTTEMFSYAEVYWSYVINRYFDERTPLYRLARCRNNEEKYYENGTLVRKIGNGKFVNLLEYFNMHPEEAFDISDYINYCMEDYDYTMILNSSFIKGNREVGAELAFQILLSILRMDQNFHYENINLDPNDGFKPIPPIDFEFSTPFLYPEDMTQRSFYIKKYLNHLSFPTMMQYEIKKALGGQIDLDPWTKIMKNIFVIVRDYPEVVDRFMGCLESYYKDIDAINLSDEYGFIEEEASSEYWQIGHAKYKDNDEAKSRELMGKIKKQPIDKDRVFALIKEDNKRVVERLRSIIKGMRLMREQGIEDMDMMTIDRLWSIIGNNLSASVEDVYRKVLEY